MAEAMAKKTVYRKAGSMGRSSVGKKAFSRVGPMETLTVESTAATKGDEVAAKMAERLAGSMVLQSVVAMVSVWVG